MKRIYFNGISKLHSTDLASMHLQREQSDLNTTAVWQKNKLEKISYGHRPITQSFQVLCWFSI